MSRALPGRLLCLPMHASAPSVPSGALAQAQRGRVAMSPLEGRGSAAARRVLVDDLTERGFSVVSVDEAPADDAATAAVARRAGVAAVIGGRALSRRGRWSVSLWVRDAGGTQRGTVRRRVRGARGVRRVVAALARILIEVTQEPGPGSTRAAPSARAGSAAPAERSAREAEAAGPRPTAASASGAVPAPGASGSGAAGGAGPGGAGPGGAAPGGAAPGGAAPGAASAARDEPPAHARESAVARAWLLVGAGIRTRAFELLSPDGADAGYRAGPYLELAARGGARFFDVLLLRASFGSSIALESEREDPALGTLQTWFVRARGDVGAQVALDPFVELGVAIGVGWDRHQIEFNELVPTAEYLYARPAALASFRLAGDALVLAAEVGARFAWTVGDLEALHGPRHEVWGLDVIGRLGGVVEPGFEWSLQAGARRYWLAFERPDGQVSGFDGGWHATALVGWRL